jgi:hypothetical protein
MAVAIRPKIDSGECYSTTRETSLVATGRAGASVVDDGDPRGSAEWAQVQLLIRTSSG